MTIEQTIAANTEALEENTKALQGLIALLKAPPALLSSVPVAVDAPGAKTATEKTPTGNAAVNTAGEPLTYSVVSTAFLALIKKLGSSDAAKKAVLDPLKLENLKDNKEKPELFPAIMEKINAANAAAEV